MGVESVQSNAGARRTLRRLELEAYSSVVSAFRAQGPLTGEKKVQLELLSKHLGISSERHRAEVRRAVNDELLSSVAARISGTSTEIAWRKEGQKLASTNPRFVSRQVTHLPQTITSAIVSTTLGLLVPGEKDEPKKNTSTQLQHALKFIISQNPLNAPKAPPGGVAGGRGNQMPSPTAAKVLPKPPSYVESKSVAPKGIDAVVSSSPVPQQEQRDTTTAESKSSSQVVRAPVSSSGPTTDKTVEKTPSPATPSEPRPGGNEGTKTVEKEVEVKVQSRGPVGQRSENAVEEGVAMPPSQPVKGESERISETNFKPIIGDDEIERQTTARTLPPDDSNHEIIAPSASINTVPSVVSVAVGTSPSSKATETSIVKAMLTTPISLASRSSPSKVSGTLSATPSLHKPPVTAKAPSTEAILRPTTSTGVPVPVLTKSNHAPSPLPPTRKRPLPPDSLPPPSAKKPAPPQLFTPSPSHTPPLPPSHIPMPALTPIMPPESTLSSTPHTITPTPTKTRSPPPLVLAASFLDNKPHSPVDNLDNEDQMANSPTDKSPDNLDVPMDTTSVSSPPAATNPVKSISVATGTEKPSSLPQPSDTGKEGLGSSSNDSPVVSAVSALARSPYPSTPVVTTIAPSLVPLPMASSTAQTLGREVLRPPSSPPPTSTLSGTTDEFIQALCSATASMEDTTISALASELGLDFLDPVDPSLLGISPDIMQLVEPSIPALGGEGGGSLPGPSGGISQQKTAVVTDTRLSSDVPRLQTFMLPFGPDAIPRSSPSQLPLVNPDLRPLLPPDACSALSPLEQSLFSPVSMLDAPSLPSGDESASPTHEDRVLSDFCLDESDLLEGIPPELAETIQAIARLDEQSTTQMTSPFRTQ